jgi:hypothetical protein
MAIAQGAGFAQQGDHFFVCRDKLHEISIT